MERYIVHWCEFLIDTWRNASFTNYAVLVLTIIVSGWLVSRYGP